MAEQAEKSDDKIKVTVKTPREKKEIQVEGNGSIKQVKFDVCANIFVLLLFIKFRRKTKVTLNRKATIITVTI